MEKSEEVESPSKGEQQANGAANQQTDETAPGMPALATTTAIDPPADDNGDDAPPAPAAADAAADPPEEDAKPAEDAKPSESTGNTEVVMNDRNDEYKTIGFDEKEEIDDQKAEEQVDPALEQANSRKRLFAAKSVAVGPSKRTKRRKFSPFQAVPAILYSVHQ